MRLLIAGAKAKLNFLKEFGEALQKLGIECKVVHDVEIYDTFPSINIRNWLGSRTEFKKLISDFKPDAVFVDRASHFALAVEDEKIPLFILLRGDFWSEVQWESETTYKNPIRRVILWQWKKMNERYFKNSSMILPVCKYLENIVKERYPKKPTDVLYGGINIESWSADEEMDLKHPCVGLLQDANIWGKTMEMLTLTKVMESMSDVTFYWAGDGPYRNQILPALRKFENFKWLGSLQSQEQVRRYLASIDVYALPSGIDMSPSSLREAQIMGKPVVATNVGGIPETMQNEKTGFLVGKGDYKGWVEKLSLLLNDKEKAKQMGTDGKNFVIENFSWEKIAGKFVDIVQSNLGK